jgi:hypothetical protein
VENETKRLAESASLRNPILVGALFLVSFLLLVLIALVVANGLSNSKGPGAVVTAQPPPPIQNPERIKGVLRVGKTYELALTAGIFARVEDKAYTIKTVTNMVYRGECVIQRRIEKNDGAELIELRKFDVCRTVKLESHVDDLRFEWGTPGELVLASLEFYVPGSYLAVHEGKPFVEALSKSFAQQLATDHIQAWRKLDSLEGKTVRITYRDGVGVTRLEPIGCTLTTEEESFLNHTSAFADYWLLPDLNIGKGKEWPVDAANLAALIDPSLRGVPRGQIVLKRVDADAQFRADSAHAVLQIADRRVVTLDQSDDKTQRIGTFVPSGSFWFNTRDEFLEQAALKGDFTIEQVSKDHLLFETTMRTKPALDVQYSCKLIK